MRELPSKPIVTEIQFKKNLEPIKLMRHSTTESVGVNVEESEIHKQAKLFWQIPSNVTMIEINASNRTDLGVV